MSLSNNERQWKDLSDIEKVSFLNRATYLLERGYILDNVFHESFASEVNYDSEELEKLAEKIFKKSVY